MYQVVGGIQHEHSIIHEAEPRPEFHLKGGVIRGDNFRVRASGKKCAEFFKGMSSISRTLQGCYVTAAHGLAGDAVRSFRAGGKRRYGSGLQVGCHEKHYNQR